MLFHATLYSDSCEAVTPYKGLRSARAGRRRRTRRRWPEDVGWAAVQKDSHQ